MLLSSFITMLNNYTVTLPDNLESIRFAFFIVEYFILLIALMVTGLWIYHLVNARYLHFNFRLCCYNVCVTLLVSMITRMFIAAHIIAHNHLIPPTIKMWIQYIHNISTNQFYFNLVVLGGERLLATIFLRQYEHVRWNPSIVIIAVTWMTNIVIYQLRNIGIFHFYVFHGSLSLLTIVMGIMILALYRVNKNMKKHFEVAGLTERYQTFDNIRQIQKISIFSLIGTLHNFVCLGYSIWNYQYSVPRGNIQLNGYIDTIWNCTNAIASFAYPIPFIWSSKYVWELFRRLRGNTNNTVGQQQNFCASHTKEQCSDMYFQQLGILWTQKANNRHHSRNAVYPNNNNKNVGKYKNPVSNWFRIQGSRSRYEVSYSK